MGTGHVLVRRISGQPDDAEHGTQVFRSTLLDPADAEIVPLTGAGGVVERLVGTRRTEGAR